MADPTCALFDSASPLDRNALNRFVVGADPTPRTMTRAEVKALGDPVATLLFTKGRIPRTAEQTVEMMKVAASANSPLKEQRSFVVAEGHEGSQTLANAQAPAADAGHGGRARPGGSGSAPEHPALRTRSFRLTSRTRGPIGRSASRRSPP